MNKCKLHYFRSVGKFFVFFEHEIVKRRRNVALTYNTRITAVLIAFYTTLLIYNLNIQNGKLTEISRGKGY